MHPIIPLNISHDSSSFRVMEDIKGCFQWHQAGKIATTYGASTSLKCISIGPYTQNTITCTRIDLTSFSTKETHQTLGTRKF
jgi:hypothetical protein